MNVETPVEMRVLSFLAGIQAGLTYITYLHDKSPCKRSLRPTKYILGRDHAPKEHARMVERKFRILYLSHFCTWSDGKEPRGIHSRLTSLPVRGMISFVEALRNPPVGLSTWSTDPCYASDIQVPGTHYGIAVPQE